MRRSMASTRAAARADALAQASGPATARHILGALVFLAASIWLLIDPEPRFRLRWASSTTVRVIAIVFAVFWAALALALSVDVLRRRRDSQAP